MWTYTKIIPAEFGKTSVQVSRLENVMDFADRIKDLPGDPSELRGIGKGLLTAEDICATLNLDDTPVHVGRVMSAVGFTSRRVFSRVVPEGRVSYTLWVTDHQAAYSTMSNSELFSIYHAWKHPPNVLRCYEAVEDFEDMLQDLPDAPSKLRGLGKGLLTSEDICRELGIKAGSRYVGRSMKKLGYRMRRVSGIVNGERIWHSLWVTEHQFTYQGMSNCELFNVYRSWKHPVGDISFF